MMAFDRRGVGAGVIAAAAASLVPVWRASASPLPFPAQPMRLSRVIERSLHDGNRILVTRDWIVRFAESGRGMRVDGFQVDVRVDAPAKLAALAEIERARDTNGRFPILLGADGQILGAGAEDDAAAVEQAVHEAERIIRQSHQGAAQKGAAFRNLAAIQAAGGSVLDTMPTDLFFPAKATERSKRQLALPDGSVGEFELQHVAAHAEDGPWLARLERRIVTRLAQTERSSREVWSMVSA